MKTETQIGEFRRRWEEWVKYSTAPLGSTNAFVLNLFDHARIEFPKTNIIKILKPVVPEEILNKVKTELLRHRLWSEKWLGIGEPEERKPETGPPYTVALIFKDTHIAFIAVENLPYSYCLTVEEYDPQPWRPREGAEEELDLVKFYELVFEFSHYDRQGAVYQFAGVREKT